MRGQEDLSEGLEGLVGHSEGPRKVERRSRNGQEWSSFSPREPGGIGPSQRAGRGQEAILAGWYCREGQEVCGGPPGGPGGVGKPSQKVGRCRETLPEVSEGSGVPPWWAGRGLEALLLGQ